MESISKAFGDNLLIDNLSFSLPPGGIVGVIGPNGAGKSTLFRMLTGQEYPDSGAVEFGDTVQLSYVDQSRADLDGKKTVWEEISGGQEIIALGDAEMNSRAYCGAFNFKGGDQQKPLNLYLVVKEIASTWQSCFAKVEMSFSSTNLQMIWM